jgi:hypothetical protein
MRPQACSSGKITAQVGGYNAYTCGMSAFVEVAHRPSERGHDAVDRRHERGHGGSSRGVHLLVVLLLRLGPGRRAFGEPALDARPRLRVRLAGRVPDRLLEPPALALLPVPHQPRLALPSSTDHGHGRRARRRIGDHRRLRRRHLKTIAFSETEQPKGHERSLLSMIVIRRLRCGSWSGRGRRAYRRR